MAVSIARGSGDIHINRRPTAPRPAMNGGLAVFTPGDIDLTGSVRFEGTDPRAGWVVGWIQTEWVETSWADYRGRHDSDGSIFLQRARPPARRRGASRDTLVVGDIFTRPTDQTVIPAGPLPINVALDFNDQPGDNYRQIEPNHVKGVDNFLHEVQLEFMFATIFTARDPAGNFHHLAHVYWNLRWQYRFFPTAFPPTDVDWRRERVAAGTGAAVSRVFHGAPNDPRFAGVLTTPQADNSNSLAAAAQTAVANPHSPNRHESARWDSWDVRRP
jgi:hypothetical protein